MKPASKKLIPTLVFLALACLLWVERERSDDPGGSSGHSDDALATAFEHRRSNLDVEAEGVVIKVLPDDNEGSRHQRFIVKLRSGQTLIIAHNIDLARRILSLAEGDSVAFRGEYEWNPQGGVIHWTHHDPGGRHVAGWLMHDGKKYQ
ncbi:MAG: DUF3465 domain-containing protein [Verrucomicrobia bacterium]|nr:DUF3465 domain-containing protein [Verrucomicrobiota bacterium]